MSIAPPSPGDLTDVHYEIDRGLATITLNRPDRLNAFRMRTIEDLLTCLEHATQEPSVGVVCLTGAGDRAFCAGGDVKLRAEQGGYGVSRRGAIDITAVHRAIREIRKPVIAAVNGLAVGGGHVLHVLCDMSIAAETARFGQVGPKVGSFDAAYGTALLARCVGEKRAREIWYLCDLYDARTAERWGLVNAVVPLAELRSEVRRRADRMLALSPTAVAFLKRSFNANSEPVAPQVVFDAYYLFRTTAEAKEGPRAFVERRAPRFRETS